MSMLKKTNKKSSKIQIAPDQGASCLNMERLLVESMPLCVKMFDAQGNLLFINKHGREEHSLRGWSDGQIRKWDYLQCLVPKSRPHVQQAMRDALAGKSSHFTIEHSHTHARGGFCSSSIVPVKTNGETQFILFSSLDITERKKAEEALKESKDKYRTLVENAGQVILVVQDSQIKFVNRTAIDFIGRQPKDLLNKPFIDYVHPDDKKMVDGNYLRRIQGKNVPHHYSFRIVDRSGAIKWVEINAVLIQWYGKPATLNFLSNINERKKAEVALQKSEKRYHDIFEASQDALMLLDGKGFFDCNRATLKIFGYKTVKEFCSMHPGQVSPPTQPDGTRSMKLANQRIREAYQKGSNLFEWIHRRKNGADFPASVLLVPFELEGRKVLQATVRDITEQKISEERIKEIQRRLEADHAIAGMGSYSLTIATGKWESSDILDGIFGIDEKYSHTVRGWTMLIHPDDRRMMVDYFANEVLGKRQRFDKEYRIIRPKDKKERWVHGFGDLENGKNGKPAKMIGVIMDISEQKKVEQAKMELISMASHQLRTPPTGIKWFANMLLEEDAGKINPKQRSYLNEILFNNQKMIDLVHSLLNVSRIELGTFFVSANLQRIRATTVIDDILEELGSQIRDQKLTVIKKYGKNLPPLQVDSGLFRIILQNLINNAIQYTNNGDRITVGVKRKKSELLITVSDTGLGIPKAQQPNLFSKFFRAGNAIERKIQGTGLGLYIAKTLATSMGGALKFKSTLGKGSTFFLTIPIKSKIPIIVANH